MKSRICTRARILFSFRASPRVVITFACRSMAAMARGRSEVIRRSPGWMRSTISSSAASKPWLTASPLTQREGGSGTAWLATNQAGVAVRSAARTMMSRATRGQASASTQSVGMEVSGRQEGGGGESAGHEKRRMVACVLLACVDPTIMYDATAARSEERRVGKECRFGWLGDHTIYKLITVS